MPVLVDNGPKPPGGHAGGLEIGLVNSMPDAALEATERQFIELIDAAADDIPVRLRFFSLPDVPRTARGQQHVSKSYLGIGDLWDGRLDALIVTGTEPRAAARSAGPCRARAARAGAVGGALLAGAGRADRLGRAQHHLDHLVLPGGACGRSPARRRRAAGAVRQMLRHLRLRQ